MPVTHELVVGRLSQSGPVSAGATLATQELRLLAADKEFDVLTRAIPFEPAESMSADKLAWEYKETWSFQQKQLKKDPRLKPDDIRPTFDHLEQCTSCEQRAKMTRIVHQATLIDIGPGWQLLVDDHVVGRWRNVVRFLNQPSSQQIVMRPTVPQKEARFGCPCSILQGRGNRTFQLYHSSGQVAGPAYRYTEWPKAMRVASSLDGVQWGSADQSEPLTFDGGAVGMTGTFTAVGQEGKLFLSGYEGANSKACLARSTDGRTWKTIPTGLPQKGNPERLRKRRRRKDTGTAANTPLHLTRSKFNLRSNKVAVRACTIGIHFCLRNGTGWGHGGMMVCLVRLLQEGKIENPDCVSTLTAWAEVRKIDCTDGSQSRLGRAADAYVQPLYDGRRQLVWYRRDYGGPGGWREIRGVQVVEVNASINYGLGDLNRDPLTNVGSYYLDRMGKLERFRRQIYTLSFTRRSKNLWLGLMTVIEWAKDLDEAAGPQNPAFQRDTTNVYLVTSRDGIHIDDEWVYAHQPLLSKGRLQVEWNSGFMLPAAQIVADKEGTESRIYFEARRVRHEERFNEAATIGLAKWQFDRLAGVRAADPANSAFFVTKPFLTKGSNLGVLLNVGVPDTCAGAVRVEIFLENSAASAVQGIVKLPLNKRAFERSRSGNRVRVGWTLGEQPGKTDTFSTLPNSTVRLRFTLQGAARLYAFRVIWPGANN